jgi:hypothetical protein
VARRLSLMILFAFFLLAQADSRGQEVIVPAGTIVQCTLEDAKLSSQTAVPDDPILCETGNLREFGASVFPRGAYLEGRFTGARDPGHLWGKGWMQIEFDQLMLPGAELPITTRVTSVPNLKVDLKGRIQGMGHAGRDAIEWAIPVLWPEKVVHPSPARPTAGVEAGNAHHSEAHGVSYCSARSRGIPGQCAIGAPGSFPSFTGERTGQPRAGSKRNSTGNQ